MKIFIKTIHTIIWAFMVLVIFYILYTGITDSVGFCTYLAIAIMIGEILALLLFRWKCPLTVWYMKYSDVDWDIGDDIYLPRWLAYHNKNIFGAILILAIGSVIYRLF